jgi:hypothetical protein
MQIFQHFRQPEVHICWLLLVVVKNGFDAVLTSMHHRLDATQLQQLSQHGVSTHSIHSTHSTHSTTDILNTQEEQQNNQCFNATKA